ncbi:FUSC family protein [Adhaeribacter aquaticus]|uniref:FUSC family protein n=1 Tax=Adhaeribacter aquaticus TaxID=299567 RepID=UPI000A06755D|nr:FUSC family protein [Adhaeribacter aquaticus]
MILLPSMSDRNKTLIIYTLKNISGLLLCYGIARLIPEIDYAWSLISVVLVLSPEGKDALNLTKTRIKANIVGGLTGILILLTRVPNPVNICVGAAISLFICDRLKLNDAARSTLAALIIILLHEPGVHPWDAALSRISAVAFGCLVGLGVSLVFHSIFKINAPVTSPDRPQPKAPNEA